MVSVKHLVSLLVFEAVAILPIFLVLYWAQNYAGGFSWTTGNKLKFNYHPVFMIIGFIFIMGHGELFNSIVYLNIIYIQSVKHLFNLFKRLYHHY